MYIESLELQSRNHKIVLKMVGMVTGIISPVESHSSRGFRSAILPQRANIVSSQAACKLW